jgi:hypothetical protein
LARAYALAGNSHEKDMWLARAREALRAVADKDDRAPIEADLNTIE